MVAVAQTASAAIHASERQVLVYIYTSTNGASWTASTNWNGAPGTECAWYGISGEAGQLHVPSILLSSNNLTGSLPALTGLTKLTSFFVGKNKLTGALPAPPASLPSGFATLYPKPLNTTPGANDAA
jgi:hypothetical protein